jgi:hypothetical protein
LRDLKQEDAHRAESDIQTPLDAPRDDDSR